jgi:hypothetical protein
MSRETCARCAAAPEGYVCLSCRDSYLRGLAGQVEALQAEMATLRSILEPIPCGHTRGDLWSEQHATAQPYCTVCRLHTECEEAATDAEAQEERADRLAEALREALDGWGRVPCAGDKSDAEVIARLRALLPKAGP